MWDLLSGFGGGVLLIPGEGGLHEGVWSSAPETLAQGTWLNFGGTHVSLDP